MKDFLMNIVSNVNGALAKINVMREYLQIYALRTIFENGRFAQVAFVGGTALRFVFGLPRFSEDLDFSLTDASGYNFTEMLSEIKRAFVDANYSLTVKLSDEKTVNSAFLKFTELLQMAEVSDRRDQNLSIKLEVDTKPPKGARIVSSLVNKYFPVTFSHYDLPSLFAGKLHAIFTRPYVKGRDYFDLVWLLSRYRELVPNFEFLNNALEQTGSSLRVTTKDWGKKVFQKIKTTDWQQVVSEIEKFSEDPLFINSMKLEYVKTLLLGGKL